MTIALFSFTFPKSDNLTSHHIRSHEQPHRFIVLSTHKCSLTWHSAHGYSKQHVTTLTYNRNTIPVASNTRMRLLLVSGTMRMSSFVCTTHRHDLVTFHEPVSNGLEECRPSPSPFPNPLPSHANHTPSTSNPNSPGPMTGQ